MSGMTSTMTLAEAQWLLSDDASRAMAEAREWLEQGAAQLRVAERLRSRLTAEQSALVLTQLDLRTRAALKFPLADQMFFTRPGLEQATSSNIAVHTAQRFRDSAQWMDLCCGIGGDLLALTRTSDGSGTALDIDPAHLLFAEHNLRVHHRTSCTTFRLEDATTAEIPERTSVFVDPARRSTAGKLRGYESEPPLPWAIGLARRCEKVGIKTAPGLPLDVVPPDWEVEMISLGFDLKEAVLWSPSCSDGRQRTATTIVGSDAITFHGVPSSVPSAMALRPGQWLVDLNPAITRAGLVRDYASVHSLGMVDDHIGFLVSQDEHTTPFARSYHILADMPWNERAVRKRIREFDGGPIDLRRRGLAGDVDAITKRLRGSGDRRLFIAMTRSRGEPWAIICDHRP